MTHSIQCNQRLTIKGGTREIILGTIIGWLIKIITCTIRCQVCDTHNSYRALDPFILCFWHRNILPCTVAWDKFTARRDGLTCLTSSSRDGAIIASFMKIFRISSIRGSSSRRGITAMLELKKALARGSDVAITPDGPRGPAATFQAGAIKLAQLTGNPIVPMTVDCSQAWHLSTWDAFCIPRPFSSIKINLHAPIYVPRDADDAALEALREKCQTILSPNSTLS